MLQTMRGIGNLNVFMLLAFVFLLLLTLLISFDYLGVFNLQNLLPPDVLNWLEQFKIIQKYLEKSRFYRLTPDEQVREFTLVYTKKLKLWEETLSTRDEELNQRSNDLDSLKQQLAGISVELIRDRGMQVKREDDFKQRLEEYEDGQRKLKELAMLYEKLTPPKAAAIMEELPEGLVVRIMRLMRTNKRSLVIAAMDDKEGAKLTRMMSDEEQRTFNNRDLEQAKQPAIEPAIEK
ncbi:MAG: hypothetical protein QGH40_16550 [bacterium]|nr:hypothetical protein [bacterium]